MSDMHTLSLVPASFQRRWQRMTLRICDGYEPRSRLAPSSELLLPCHATAWKKHIPSR